MKRAQRRPHRYVIEKAVIPGPLTRLGASVAGRLDVPDDLLDRSIVEVVLSGRLTAAQLARQHAATDLGPQLHVG